MQEGYNLYNLEPQFKSFLTAGNVSPITIKNYLSDFRHFAGWLEHHNSTDFQKQPVSTNFNQFQLISTRIISEYRSYLVKNNLPHKTINRRLSALRKFFSFCISQGLMKENPAKQISNISHVGSDPRIVPVKALISPKLDGLSFPRRWESRLKSLFRDVINRLDPRLHGDDKQIENDKKPIRENPLPISGNLSIQQYVAFLVILIFVATLGAGIYNQFFLKSEKALAYPTALTRAGRLLSFQGRLTDSLSNPIATATNVTFKLYSVSSGGVALYTAGACSLTPDQDGIFNVLIGGSGYSPTPPQTVCGTEVDSSIFSENADVYLGITVASDSEMTPRQQIANVGYAINSETLQGLPPGSNVANIPYINSQGNLLIAASNPGLHSTYASSTFTISSAQATTIQSAGTGDIVLQATESGTLKFRTGGATDAYTRITVDNGGNVGIGTTAPAAGSKLHVEGQCVAMGTLIRRRRRRRRRKKNGDDDEDDWEDVPVEDIEVDDEVLTLNEETGNFEWQTVEETMDKGIQTSYEIITENGKRIETTGNHPYLVRLFEESKSQNKSNDGQTECNSGFCININQKIITDIKNFHNNLRNLKATINDTIANKISAVNMKKLDFLRTENVGEIIKTMPNQPADKFTNRSERIKTKEESNFIFPNLTNKSGKVNGKWTKVSYLNEGDEIATVNGFKKIVLIKITGRKQMYDLQIANTHNFVAGHYVNSKTGRALTAKQEVKYLQYLATKKSAEADSLTSKHTDVVVPDLSVTNLTDKQEFVKRQHSLSHILGKDVNEEDIVYGGIVAHNTYISGNVGIGTTNPVQKLHVEGQCITGDSLLYTVPSGQDGSQFTVHSSQNNQVTKIQIKDVKPGTEVYSRNDETGKIETQRINKLLDMGVKPVFKLITESGKEIRTTGNHPYLVQLTNDELNTRVQLRETGSLEENYGLSQGSLSESYEFSQTRELWTGRSTAQSGNLNSSQYSRGERQIREQGVYPIRNSSLSKVSGRTEIFNSTTGSSSTSTNTRDQQNAFRTDKLSQEKNNLVTKKSAEADLVDLTSSSNSWLDNLKRNITKEKSFVKYQNKSGVDPSGVEPDRLGLSSQPSEPAEPTPNLLSQDNIENSTWAKVIYLSPGDKIAIISSPCELRSVNCELYVVWDKIQSIEYVGEEQVYDIEVENTHNFIANGILAHNTYMSGNVGIGTTAPSQQLELTGDLKIGGDDLFMATNTANYFLMADGTNYNPVTPAAARTGLGLDAGGAGDIWVDEAGDTMTGNLTFSGAQKIIGGTGTTSDLTLQTTSGVGATGADMHFLTGNNGVTEAMTILNSGSVGIGTTAPGYALEVAGQSSGNGSFSADYFIDLGSISYGIDPGGTANPYLPAGYSLKITGGALLAADSGSVGIGTTAPVGKLDVTDTSNTAASLSLTNNTATTIGAGANTLGVLDLQSTSLTTGNFLNIETNVLTSGRGLNLTSTSTGLTGDLASIIASGSNAAVTGNVLKVGLTGALSTGTALNVTTAGASGFALRVNDDGTYTDTTPFVIDSAGNVGIGTTSPTEKLDINGNINLTGYLTSRLSTTAPGGGYIYGGGNNIIPTGVSSSFENNISGWTPRSGLSLSQSTDFAYSGTKSLKATNDSATTSFQFGTNLGTYLQDDTQEDFVATAWVYIPTASGLPSVYLQYRDGGTNFYTSGTTYNSPTITTKDAWTKIILPFKASATINAGYLYFWGGSSANGQYMYVDNIQIQKGTIPTEFGSFTCDLTGKCKSENDFYVTSGNVGIGTTGPIFPLEVNGIGQTTAALTDAGVRGGTLSLVSNSGTAGMGGAIVFGNSQSVTANSTGWAAIKGLLTNGGGNTLGDLAFSTRNGTGDTALTERMRILAGGNVGIGTTGPGKKLDISGGQLRLTEGTTNRYALLYEDGLHFTRSSDGAETGKIDYDGVDQITYNSAGGGAGVRHLWQVNSGDVMAIDNSGNVGIGTTAPGYKLEVNLGATTGVYPLRLYSSGVSTDIGSLNSSWLHLNTTATSGFYFYDTVQAGAGNNQLSISSGNSYLAASGGNVGIGTTGPDNLLELYKSQNVIASNTNIYPLKITSFDSSGGLWANQSAGIQFEVGAQSTTPGVVAEIIGHPNGADPTYGWLKFGTNTDGAMSTKMTIDYSGNVGIGTTAPLSKLSVGGVGDASSTIYGYKNTTNGHGVSGEATGLNSVGVYGYNNSSSGYGIYSYNSSTGTGVYGSSATGTGVYGYTGGAGTGVYAVNASTGYALYCNATTANKCGGNQNWYNSVSDRRLKENIIPIKGALEKVMNLKGVSYNLKSDGTKTVQIGFIAQDVLPYVPEVIGHNEETDMYGISLAPLTAVLVNAIQEQQAQINSLSGQLAELNLTSAGDVQIVPTTNNAEFVYNGNLEETKNQVLSIKYQVSSITQGIIERIGVFSELVAGKIQAGLIQAENVIVNQTLVAKNIVAEKIVSPIVETNKVVTNEIKPVNNDLIVDLSSPVLDSRLHGNDKGALARLIIKGLEGKSAVVIDAAGNASFSGQIIADSITINNDATVSGNLASNTLTTNEASISGKLIAGTIESSTINDIQSLLADIKNQPIPDPTNYQNLPDQQFNSVTTDQLTVTGNSNLYNVSVSNSLLVGTTLIDQNSIISLASELRLSALSSINLLDGAVIIARDGTITTRGELIAEKGIRTNEIKPLTDNSHVLINNLAINNLAINNISTNSAVIAAPDNFAQNGIFAPAIETATSSAGLGILPENSSEVVIYNNNVKENSLIYLTPTSPTTSVSQLTVGEKSTGTKLYFKVISNTPSTLPTKFNWLIIN